MKIEKCKVKSWAAIGLAAVLMLCSGCRYLPFVHDVIEDVVTNAPPVDPVEPPEPVEPAEPENPEPGPAPCEATVREVNLPAWGWEVEFDCTVGKAEGSARMVQDAKRGKDGLNLFNFGVMCMRMANRELFWHEARVGSVKPVAMSDHWARTTTTGWKGRHTWRIRVGTNSWTQVWRDGVCVGEWRFGDKQGRPKAPRPIKALSFGGGADAGKWVEVELHNLKVTIDP